MKPKPTPKKKPKPSAKKIKEALMEFVKDVELTGGVGKSAKGDYFPLADRTWVDLAETYVRACEAMGRRPKIDRNVSDMEDVNIDEAYL